MKYWKNYYPMGEGAPSDSPPQEEGGVLSSPTFTKKEIHLFLQGMKYARRLAIETGKGITSSGAITQEIQKLNLQTEVAAMRGRL